MNDSEEATRAMTGCFPLVGAILGALMGLRAVEATWGRVALFALGGVVAGLLVVGAIRLMFRAFD